MEFASWVVRLLFDRLISWLVDFLSQHSEMFQILSLQNFDVIRICLVCFTVHELRYLN
jgi:hypothetical protein